MRHRFRVPSPAAGRVSSRVDALSPEKQWWRCYHLFTGETELPVASATDLHGERLKTAVSFVRAARQRALNLYHSALVYNSPLRGG